MNEFIEKNRRFLKFCSYMARFYGILCLIAAGAAIAIFVVGAISRSPAFENARKFFPNTLSRIPSVAFYGFVALIVAEFISYMLASEGEPKWILRHGEKFIYAYVLFTVVMIIRVLSYISITPELTVRGLSRLGPTVFIAMSEGARVLMWVGIGITLKKVLPIIKESKLVV